MKEPENNLQGSKPFASSLLLLNVIMCFFLKWLERKTAKKRQKALRLGKQGNRPEGYNMTSHLRERERETWYSGTTKRKLYASLNLPSAMRPGLKKPTSSRKTSMQTSLKQLRQQNSSLNSSLWKWVVEAPTTQLVLTTLGPTSLYHRKHGNTC